MLELAAIWMETVDPLHSLESEPTAIGRWHKAFKWIVFVSHIAS
jgi:hypothetical protein